MFTRVNKLSSVLCAVALCMNLSAPAMASDRVSKNFTVSNTTDNQLAEEVAHAIRSTGLRVPFRTAP